MMGKYRGHRIEKRAEGYFYSDNKKLVRNDPNRACGNCGKSNTKEGHDGCIGELPSVMNACCGHGIVSDAYIQYLNGKIIRGLEAAVVMNKL